MSTSHAEEELKSPVAKKDNPRLGVIFFILSGVSFAFNFIFAKIIYESKPQTSPLQLLAYRSIISTAIMAVTINRNLKYVMFDSIPEGKWYPLCARVVQGNFTIYVNFTSIKFFTLTMVAVVNNFAPLMTVVLAGILLGEHMPTFKLVQLLIAFGGAVLMIVASPAPVEDDTTGDED